jgi:hypothetical protein
MGPGQRRSQALRLRELLAIHQFRGEAIKGTYHQVRITGFPKNIPRQRRHGRRLLWSPNPTRWACTQDRCHTAENLQKDLLGITRWDHQVRARTGEPQLHWMHTDLLCRHPRRCQMVCLDRLCRHRGPLVLGPVIPPAWLHGRGRSRTTTSPSRKNMNVLQGGMHKAPRMRTTKTPATSLQATTTVRTMVVDKKEITYKSACVRILGAHMDKRGV